MMPKDDRKYVLDAIKARSSVCIWTVGGRVATRLWVVGDLIHLELNPTLARSR